MYVPPNPNACLQGHDSAPTPVRKHPRPDEQGPLPAATATMEQNVRIKAVVTHIYARSLARTHISFSPASHARADDTAKHAQKHVDLYSLPYPKP